MEADEPVSLLKPGDSETATVGEDACGESEGEMHVDGSADNNEELSEELSDIDSAEEDDEDAEEQEAAKLILELEASVKENPYAYDSYPKLIAACKEAGDLQKLRDARNAMVAVYPLTEDLWMDWLQDEVSLVGDAAERDRVETLFEKAVADYLSVPLWVERCTFAIGSHRITEDEGVDKVRQAFEAAIKAVGLHCSKGVMIWAAYREFETAVCDGLQPPIGGIATVQQQQNVAEQTDRIASLFRRQLAIPLIGMDETLAEYESWVGGDIPSDVKQSYDVARAKLEEFLSLEHSIEGADYSTKPGLYRKYINKELEGGSSERVCCTYERALADGCSLVADLWAEYGVYSERHVQDGTAVLKLYQRAIRNCPWSSLLWIAYLRCMEKQSQPRDLVLETFEKALQSGFNQGSDYLEIWCAYCDYQRRQIDWQSDYTEAITLLRQTFDRAINYLLQYFGEAGDAGCILPKYWALIEAKYCKEIDRARQIWNDAMVGENAGRAQMWLEYLTFERSYGDVKHCRKVAQRAMKAVSDWPESICNAYLTFEREEGSLEHLYIALNRVAERQAKDKERQEIEAVAKAREKKHTAKSKPQVFKRASGRPAPKDAKPASGEQRVAYDKGQGEPRTTSNDGFADGAAAASVAAAAAADDNEASVSAGGASASKPSRHPDLADEQLFKVPELPSSGVKRAKPVLTEDEPPGKKARSDSSTREQTDTSYTVFVSNLDYSVSEDALKELLSQVGEINSVRLVKKRTGESKGYGYVEFMSKAAVDKALAMDRTPLNGRPTFISQCDPERLGQSKLKFATGLEKNKLFVRGLPFTTTRQDLENIFSEHGKLKDVRVVTYRNGHSKGLAYVEYESEADAAQAILKTDGLTIENKVIVVAISNPPAHSDSGKGIGSSSGSGTFVKALGGGNRQASAARAGARTQLSMIPRSLLKEGGTAKGQLAPAPAEGQPKTTMTNADFRQMLLQ